MQKLWASEQKLNLVHLLENIIWIQFFFWLLCYAWNTKASVLKWKLWNLYVYLYVCLSMNINSVHPLYATVMKSLERSWCCFSVPPRGFLSEAFKRRDPDGSSVRLMTGDITFSQVRGHLINPHKKAFCAKMPTSCTDHTPQRVEPCLLYPFTPMALNSQG